MAKALSRRLQVYEDSNKRCLCFGNVFAIVNTSGNCYQCAASLAAMASSSFLSSHHNVDSQHSTVEKKAFKTVRKDSQWTVGDHTCLVGARGAKRRLKICVQ